eukprot:COSAG01_NODE_14219_length_1481_cov_23.180174_2_plen_133_part_00
MAARKLLIEPVHYARGRRLSHRTGGVAAYARDKPGRNIAAFRQARDRDSGVGSLATAADVRVRGEGARAWSWVGVDVADVVEAGLTYADDHSRPIALHSTAVYGGGVAAQAQVIGLVAAGILDLGGVVCPLG